MPQLEAEEREAAAALESELAAIPNLPVDDTPDGKDESDNVEIRRWGARPELGGMNKPREHFEIGEALGLMDFETAAKISGARFVVLKGALARLERALEQFMLDLHTSRARLRGGRAPIAGARRGDVRHGAIAEVRKTISLLATEFNDSASVSARADLIDEIAQKFRARHATRKLRLRRSGRGDHGSSERQARSFALWLIPTAEVPLTNLVRESIVDEKTPAAALHRRHRSASAPRRGQRGATRAA